MSGDLELADGWTLQLVDAGVRVSDGDLPLFSCTGWMNIGQVNIDLSLVSGPGFEDWQFDDLSIYDNLGTVYLSGLTVVPEPATLSLLTLCGLALVRRRRRSCRVRAI